MGEETRTRRGRNGADVKGVIRADGVTTCTVGSQPRPMGGGREVIMVVRTSPVGGSPANTVRVEMAPHDALLLGMAIVAAYKDCE